MHKQRYTVRQVRVNHDHPLLPDQASDYLKNTRCLKRTPTHLASSASFPPPPPPPTQGSLILSPPCRFLHTLYSFQNLIPFSLPHPLPRFYRHDLIFFSTSNHFLLPFIVSVLSSHLTQTISHTHKFISFCVFSIRCSPRLSSLLSLWLHKQTSASHLSQPFRFLVLTSSTKIIY